MRENPGMSEDCDFCHPDQGTFKDSILGETENFLIAADAHPLTEGHILIVPKEHLPCVGTFSEELVDEFSEVLETVSGFMTRAYGKFAWFEHGVLGQTVFHAHVHVLPFEGGIKEIVPEGDDMISFLEDAAELSWLYEAEQGYLAVFMREQLHVIDASLAEPRFFRKRFADALGVPEREDWSATRDAKLEEAFGKDYAKVKELWESDSELA